eukprot:TRINITY_DN4874_c0_g1_i3.p1 TRINITY_DN4874_c0_g1~~TRINITY_DN4874_c0_g1_i3.p1  ORF type:complete len:630 (-),score=109.01 TRINITY_DN4874_c0_g1_i3:525-2414(-)
MSAAFSLQRSLLIGVVFFALGSIVTLFFMQHIVEESSPPKEIMVNKVEWSSDQQFLLLDLKDTTASKDGVIVLVNDQPCISHRWHNGTIYCKPPNISTNATLLHLSVLRKHENKGFQLEYSSEIRKPLQVRKTELPCDVSEYVNSCTPHFIMVGAFKCGTTSVFKYLTLHPNVIPPIKMSPLNRPPIHGLPMRPHGEPRIHHPPNNGMNRMQMTDSNDAADRLQDERPYVPFSDATEIKRHFDEFSDDDSEPDDMLPGPKRRLLQEPEQGDEYMNMFDRNLGDADRIKTLQGLRLKKHSDILYVHQKELHFFDRDMRVIASRNQNHKEKQNSRDIMIHYMRRFPNLKETDRLMTGEATPSYMFLPHVPNAIYRVVPDVKIIFMLREPLARAYSQFCHKKSLMYARSYLLEKQGPSSNDRTPRFVTGKKNTFQLAGAHKDSFVREFISLIQNEKKVLENCLQQHKYWKDIHPCIIKPTQSTNTTINRKPVSLVERTLLSHSLYLPQLEHWMTNYPDKPYLVVVAEDMYKDASGVMNKVTQFVDLPPISWDEITKIKYNVGIVTEGQNHTVVTRRTNGLGLIPGDEDIHLECPKLPVEVVNEFREFFNPFNLKLEELLKRKLWDYSKPVRQ